MNKAKAAFAGIIIVAVASVTAVCWYMSSKNIIGADKNETGASSYNIDADENDVNNSPDDNEIAENKQSTNTAPQSTATNPANTDISDNERVNINEFLSIFSRAYFSEWDGGYTKENHSNYELIRFAYSQLKRTDPNSVITKQENDDIGSYFGISFDDANDVLDRYLGLSIKKESIYTEKTYSFFKYSDGYFYTPAADGVAYINIASADSISLKNGEYTVAFTVYSDGVTCDMSKEKARLEGTVYSTGTAVITKENNEYKLISYKLT